MSRTGSTGLRERAATLGVAVTYEDVDRVVHHADDDVLRHVVEVLDDDRRDSRRHVVDGVHVVAPTRTTSRVPVQGAVNDVTLSVEGVATPLRPDPAGDVVLPDLPVGCHRLTVESGGRTESCTIVVPPASMPSLARDRRWTSLFVPAYALWEADRPLPSFGHLREAATALGRAGVDMLATLPLYATFLDDPFDPSPYSPVSRLHWNEVYLDDADLPAAPVPALGDHVDWRELGARRRSQLIAAARDADPELVARLDAFAARRPDAADYARFRGGRDPGDAPRAVVERSHLLAQLLADEQLSGIGPPSAAGLSLDLPIGSHPDGWETWAHPDLFPRDIAVGAPPDTFFRDGQNWGFPPQLPGHMRDQGYELWRSMIECAGRHAAMLRIDHVMAVHRLWWVPDGCSADRGVYVHYPHDELLAVIAASAAVAGVAVVGENLGTVPPEVGEALDEVEMLGMFEEQFTTGGDELATIPERSVAGIRTHDMDAFAQHVATTDLADYSSRLAAALGRPVADVRGDLLDAVLERLARSDARMVVADLDDLLDERRPHNLPGRVVPGIWQRRLDRPASEVFADRRVRERLDILTRRT